MKELGKYIWHLVDSTIKRNLKTWDKLFTWPTSRGMTTWNEVWSQRNLRLHFEYFQHNLGLFLQITSFSEHHFLHLQSCGVDNSIGLMVCFDYDETSHFILQAMVPVCWKHLAPSICLPCQRHWMPCTYVIAYGHTLEQNIPECSKSSELVEIKVLYSRNGRCILRKKHKDC